MNQAVPMLFLASFAVLPSTAVACPPAGNFEYWATSESGKVATMLRFVSQKAPEVSKVFKPGRVQRDASGASLPRIEMEHFASSASFESRHQSLAVVFKAESGEVIASIPMASGWRCEGGALRWTFEGSTVFSEGTGRGTVAIEERVDVAVNGDLVVTRTSVQDRGVRKTNVTRFKKKP